MALPTVLLAIVLLVNNVQTDQLQDKYADCKTTYTLGYGYKKIYHISESGNHQGDSIFSLNFFVKAFSDAHILLSPTASPGNQDPVYEVVIGAGRNTFSDIRRQLQAQSKAKVITMDYLSDSEYRGFWIRLSKAGLLEVGNAGDSIPFIFCLDPEPLLIRYFSFSTWGSTVGRWLYSCPNDTKSQEVELPDTLTTIEQLRYDLLLHYDPNSRPILNESDTTYVSVHLTCQNFRVDEKTSVLSIGGDFTMHWEDQKLRWKPEDYDNISLLTILHHEVWQPELVLYNAADRGTDILSDTPLLVSSRGQVKWKSRANMQARCSLDLSQWPNDQHTCELLLGFWAQHEVLHLDLKGRGTQLEKGETQSSEWEILSMEADPKRLKTPWINTTSDLQDNKALSIRISFRRKAQLYKAILVVPLIVFGTMTLLPFWITPMDPNKILLSCINLVIMTLFIVILGTTLPAPPNQVPQIVLTYSQGMVAVAISLLISIMVIGLTRYNHIQPLPIMLQNIINIKTFQIMLCLPSITKQESASYEHLQEFSCDNQPTDRQSTVNAQEIKQQWILLATVIDRLACLSYAIYLITVMFNHG